jgi:hypothetical protein
MSDFMDTRRRFENDVRDHEMTVLKDDGLYRHLRFKRPDSAFYWFDIVTWPGTLMVRGDMEAYAFARTSDMFEFFRSSSDINPGYWAEKLVAPQERHVREYSENEFCAQVKQAYDDHVDAKGEDDPDLWQRIESEILNDPDICDEREARSLLHTFGEPDIFSDAWEWDCNDWRYQFIWCCYAIRHGIAAYDEVTA